MIELSASSGADAISPFPAVNQVPVQGEGERALEEVLLVVLEIKPIVHRFGNNRFGDPSGDAFRTLQPTFRKRRDSGNLLVLGRHPVFFSVDAQRRLLVNTGDNVAYQW